MDRASAPVLSTPAEHVLDDLSTTAAPTPASRLSEEQLYVQYEIRRTVDEIRNGKWKRIALQFPDEMLVDAPQVFEKLRDGLKHDSAQIDASCGNVQSASNVVESLANTHLEQVVESNAAPIAESVADLEHRLCILGDTSYGSCCVDEVAAEHVDAEVVVHYGRACLSPTARLSVIYVYTAKSLDLESAVASFKQTYIAKTEKVCLMADIPYSHHVKHIYQRIQEDGYTNVFATEIIRDPTSPLPNRTLPDDVKKDPEALQQYSIFHISDPPTSLLLILSSRVIRIHIFPTDTSSPATLESSTRQLLRQRYALVTRLSTVGVFGILINTLSVSDYMSALQHCQDLISRAGKKSYVFVVGKVNGAKIANFAEIGGWVVIGCWESSLIESKDFFRPIITPYELEAALKDDSERVWGGEWIGDFAQLLGKKSTEPLPEPQHHKDVDEYDCSSEDEPPEFDLRTGRYISNSRPMGRSKRTKEGEDSLTATSSKPLPQGSTALIQRNAAGELATINGAVSPGAEFLRSNRTWQGLGSDYEIAYERDEEGRIRGAVMEEGRSGVARGYVVGQGGESH